MKTKQHFIILLFLLSVAINYAQVSFTSAGIAVQGISRDATNKATQNATVDLVFQFFYFESANSRIPIGDPISKTVLCDNFGVFSTVIDPDATLNNYVFSNNEVWLNIKNGSVELSDSKLHHVPYAISANNGVPTGSIMPFAGKIEDVPVGWALCNGEALPTTALKLIAMIGNNTPNLGGMFLRGAGPNTNVGYEDNDGPNLNTPQQDLAGPHNHPNNINITGDSGASANGSLLANVYRGRNPTTNQVINGDTESGILISTIGSSNHTSIISSGSLSVGTHGTTKTGSVLNNTDLETRPVNYGVNYIIKL